MSTPSTQLSLSSNIWAKLPKGTKLYESRPVTCICTCPRDQENPVIDVGQSCFENTNISQYFHDHCFTNACIQCRSGNDDEHTSKYYDTLRASYFKRGRLQAPDIWEAGHKCDTCKTPLISDYAKVTRYISVPSENANAQSHIHLACVPEFTASLRKISSAGTETPDFVIIQPSFESDADSLFCPGLGVMSAEWVTDMFKATGFPHVRARDVTEQLEEQPADGSRVLELLKHEHFLGLALPERSMGSIVIKANPNRALE